MYTGLTGAEDRRQPRPELFPFINLYLLDGEGGCRLTRLLLSSCKNTSILISFTCLALMHLSLGVFASKWYTFFSLLPLPVDTGVGRSATSGYTKPHA